MKGRPEGSPLLHFHEQVRSMGAQKELRESVSSTHLMKAGFRRDRRAAEGEGLEDGGRRSQK
jgi:hypothetical protein